MEDAVRQRIISVFERYNSNPTQFSGADSAMQKRLSRQLKGGASVTYETLLSILEKYENVSAEWLLRGKGDMLITDNNQKSPLVSNGSGTIGSVIDGNVTGNGHNIGIMPADCEKALVRAQAEVDILKKKIKEIEVKHKQEKEMWDKMLQQAIADKDKAMDMLDKALSR